MRYVIHKHFAEKAGLHYDLRLEATYPGKGLGLFSFASRKLDQLIKGGVIRILLFETEWHEPFWIDFKGEIAEGYGKGKLEIFDKGEYELLKNRSIYKSYKEGHIKILMNSSKFRDYGLSLVRLDKISTLDSKKYNPRKTWVCTKLKKVEA